MRLPLFSRILDSVTSRGRRFIAIAAAALVGVLALSGVGVATFAHWNSNATVTAEVSNAALAVTATNFESANFTFQNHTLSHSGTVTVRNTTQTSSTQTAALTISLDTVNNSVHGDKVAVSMWRLPAGANCAAAPTTPVHTGTWNSVQFSEPTPLAAGDSVTYCVRSSVSERSTLASTAGTFSFQPRITAETAVGNFVSATMVTATQSTSYIYPATNELVPLTWYRLKSAANNAYCLDVQGGHGGAGTSIIDFGCKQIPSPAGHQNQDWVFSTANDSPRYVTIATRYDNTLVIGAAGGTAQVQTLESGNTQQQWQIQQRAAGQYQVVNRASGLCLQSTTIVQQPVSLRPCADTAAQVYTLDYVGVNPPALNLTCAPGGTGLTYTWNGPAVEAYRVEVAPAGTNNFSPVATVPAGAQNVAVAKSSFAGKAAGVYTVRMMWRTHQIASTTLWNETAGQNPRLSCAPATDVAVALTNATPAAIEPGSTGAATWVFTVTNTGAVSSRAGNVALTLPAASSYTVSSTLPGFAGSGTSRTFTDLAPGASGTITVTRANAQFAATPLSVGAAVQLTGPVSDTNTANNSASHTIAVKDTTAPSVPLNLTATPTSAATVNLGWTASTDFVGVTGYRVYRDGTLLPGTATGTTFTDSGLNPATTYSYQVTAVDAAGNESAKSNVDTATTHAAGPSGNNLIWRSGDILGSMVNLTYNSQGSVSADYWVQGPSTVWNIQHQENGRAKILTTSGTPRALSAQSATSVSAIAVTNSATQEWIIEAVGSGGFKIKSASEDNTCLSMSRFLWGYSAQLSPCSSSSAQTWNITP